ncbi:hypothetical protein TD95_004232 [Thielaviopsis punctulata]|uniref:protein-tyrosine-phosphatase n=1 Tax=Thielaviopsis punctulata TaxID=72032 RepID=A0A0F4Z9D5_9PEZI|nr:hypothetical protein TD95_004232 [Thielaviopsis punctulata]
MSRTARTASVGQVVEYIPDRLYLAAYNKQPDALTFFPYGEPSSSLSISRSPARRRPGESQKKSPCYFTVDDSLLYNAFHHDFGPLHIGHLYRFALYFHDILAAKENKDRPIVFWSKPDAKSRANAACMLACYMVLIQNWPPHLALAPIAQVDPPLMPFRDAGYSQADYGLTVQDVVYGVWKAKEEKCCDLENFDLDQYEKFERVEHGDFNWITPDFLAFASPQQSPAIRFPEGSDMFKALPRTLDDIDAHPTLPQPFKNVLEHFSTNNIGLVVRLNSPLYSPSYFEAMGIQHIDMIFDDGTCPPLKTVRKFIRLAHEMITVKKKGIAVHCKAGLGRTGCLIGAYLIYRHGFTANEVISFMRFMRPGMVVGPQQHWLHLNQGTFREWWIEERVEAKLRRELALANPPATPSRTQKSRGLSSASQTPTNRSPSNRTPLSEVDDRNNIGVQEDYLPVPTPGQPRKTARMGDRHYPYSRHGNANTNPPPVQKEPEEVQTAAEVVASLKQARGASEPSDEEVHMRIKSQRKSSNQPSPSHPHAYPHAPTHSSHATHSVNAPSNARAAAVEQSRSRSISHNVTTTSTATGTTTSATTVYHTQYTTIDNDASQDIENLNSRPLAKVRSSKRINGPETALRSKEGSGVRKTSGRVGSIGTGPTTSTSAAASATARKVSATGA